MIRRISTSLALASILIHVLWAGMGEVMCVDARRASDDLACTHACCEAPTPAAPYGQPHEDCCIRSSGDDLCRADALDRVRLLPGTMIAVLSGPVMPAAILPTVARLPRPAPSGPPPGTTALRTIVLQI